jgi:crotonobetaine/carnitine-CoA ligase
MGKWDDKFKRAEQKWDSWKMQEYAQHDRVLAKIIEDKALLLPNHNVFQFGDSQISFEQLHVRTNQVAQGFRELGVGYGHKVALMLPNCAEHIYCWFGLNKVGAADVPINIALRGNGLAYQINHGDCIGLVADEDYLEYLDKIIGQLPQLRFIIVLRRQSGKVTLPNWANIESLDYHDFVKRPETSLDVNVNFKDLSSILYTSGTTGPSKGVMISHHYWYKAAASSVNYARITEDDVLYTPMPFFHSAARGMTILPAILADAKAVMVERFSASGMLEDARRWNCSVANYIGGMISILMKQEARERDGDNPLRLMVGGAAPAPLWESFQQRYNTMLLELYGLTECLFNLVNPYDNRRAGSCGKPINGYRVKVVDDDDNEVPPGTVGEILVQPESMFLGTNGYYKMPEETLELTRNFWFHTGDLARMDEDGYFYYADRKKQAIRRRGENISSFEVECVINEHDAVLESCVVGVPSELGEEDVKAVVVLKEGCSLDHMELINWCKARMAYFSIPRYIAYRNSLPKTPSDRVEKYKLKEEGVTSDCWDFELTGIDLRKP